MNERLEPIVTRFVYGEVDRRKRQRLPHWQTRNGIQFVTWRLNDSLPESVVRDLEERRERRFGEPRLAGALTKDELLRIDRDGFDEIDRELDRGKGSCFMNDPRVADIVEKAIYFFDGDRYRILSESVMPNHVHVIFRTLGDNALWDIIKSWKRHSARESNRVLNRTGTFWQQGYYDRLIRDSRELSDRIRYVLNNSTKAGLQNWRWNGFNSEAIREILERGSEEGGLGVRPQ